MLLSTTPSYFLQNEESYIYFHARESSGTYFPRVLATQIHCYMTGLGPNPNLTLPYIPGMDAVVALPPAATNPFYPAFKLFKLMILQYQTE